MDNQALWVAEINAIDASIRVCEPTLYQTRWFDYWGLLPIEATLVFANQYIESYRDTYAKLYDYEKAKTLNVLRGEALLACPDLTALTRARQAADMIGCRYPYYINFVFKRCWDRCWGYMPRPNQFYSEELVMDIKDAWEADKRVSLQLANPAVGNEGHPARGAYHSYLVEQVKDRVQQHFVLARLVYKDGILPEEVARQHFSEALLERSFNHHCK